MTREEAIKTLKENYCAMCAYGSQNMDSCDIRSCDNRDAIKALEPRKGHWIKIGDRGLGYSDIVICKCSECGYKTEFVGKFDGYNLVIYAGYAANYCSNCGSDNREVEE